MAQTYVTHRRFVPLYHFVGALLTVAIVIGSFVNLFKSTGAPGFYSASLITAMSLLIAICFYYLRVFALRAQDRAIRAEENLRHYVLENKLLDSRLTMRQIIGLRFAQDDEFVELARKAAEEGTSEDDIKKSIKNWKPDEYRA